MIIRWLLIFMLTIVSISLAMEKKEAQLTKKEKSASLGGRVRKSLEALFRKQSDPAQSDKAKGTLIVDFESKAEKSYQNITPYLRTITKEITAEALKNGQKTRDQIQGAMNKIDCLDNKELIKLIALAKKDLITRINIPSWHLATCENYINAARDFGEKQNIQKWHECMEKVVPLEDEIDLSIDKLEIKRSINKVMAHLLNELERLKTLDVIALSCNRGYSEEQKKTLAALVYQTMSLRDADPEKAKVFHKSLKTVNEDPQISSITKLLQRDFDVAHLLRERMTKIANIRLTLAQYYDPTPIQNVRTVKKEPLAMACILYLKAFDSFLDLAYLEQYNQHFRNESLRVIKSFREHAFELLNKFGMRDNKNALLPQLHSYYIESCKRLVELYPEIKYDDLMVIQTQR